jgi:hypothetical protein
MAEVRDEVPISRSEALRALEADEDWIQTHLYQGS